VGLAARSAFTAQVAFAHLIVSYDASHPLQCPRAACRLAELDGVIMITRLFNWILEGFGQHRTASFIFSTLPNSLYSDRVGRRDVIWCAPAQRNCSVLHLEYIIKIK